MDVNENGIEGRIKEGLRKELVSRKKQYEYYKELLLTREKEKWEIKSLGEIATEISSGNEITKSQLGTGDYPAIRYSEIHSSNLFIRDCTSYVDPDLIKNKRYCECGDLLIVRTSEDLDNSGKHATLLKEGRVLVGNDIAILKHNQNPKYLSYILSTTFCREQMRRRSRGGIVVHIHTPQIKQIQIPLPPLEEQERIVAILDQFYELCGNVEEGIPWLINAVEEQYRYYKEEILSYQG